MGIGGSCCFIPIVSTIPRWFTKKRGIAIGITVAGFGLGGIISPPLAQWLISTYDWRQSYLILGLIAFIVVIPLAQFMKHSPQRVGLKPYGEDETVKDEQPLVTGGLSLTQAIKTSRFWIFGSMLFLFFFSEGAIIVHITPHAINIGILAIIAASVMSIIAGGSVIGRLSMGFMSDKVGGRLVLIACLTSATLALVWLLFAREVWMLYVFTVIFGIGYGGIVALQTVISAELFGLKFLGIILATLMLFATVGIALGSLLTGSIFDITGSYSLAFLICVIICALAIILSLILLKAKSWRGGD
ncbi:L-lactate transporter [subsurface metagenome]